MAIVESNRCIIVVRGSKAEVIADRMEDFAMTQDLQVMETLINDNHAYDKVKYYLEHECISSILLRSVWSITDDRDMLYEIMALAAKYGTSVNEEDHNWQAATIIWDGGDGC